MVKQRTLMQSVSVTGVGLHSGRPITLVLHPAPANTGIVFRRTDLDPVVAMSARADHVNDTRMATTLNAGSVVISTIEHLMSALNGQGIDNVLVDVSGPEIPIMDGSSRDFVSLILRAGFAVQESERRYLRVLKTVEVREGDKWARLEAHEGQVYDFSIDFSHPAIDSTVQRAVVDFSADSYTEKVAYARTFGFLKDVEYLRSIGLAQGGSMENAVVLNDEGIMNPEGLRSQDEFVKHKILDAMGDLYVLGQPMLMRYSAFKAGHALNNRLLRELLKNPDNYETVTLTTNPLRDEH